MRQAKRRVEEMEVHGEKFKEEDARFRTWVYRICLSAQGGTVPFRFRELQGQLHFVHLIESLYHTLELLVMALKSYLVLFSKFHLYQDEPSNVILLD
mgnify:CR=1 FL=1